MSRFILASGSASRAALLRQAGVAFDQVRPPLDEELEKHALRAAGAPAVEQVMALSEAKARSVARTAPEAFVLGCDQMLLVEDGGVLDKPANRQAAAAQLLRLRATWHELLTGAVLMQGETVLWRVLDRPRLRMRAFSDAFVQAYLDAAGEQVCSSVGGYQLEGLGVQLFEEVQGDWFAILGLPLLPLLAELRRVGALST